MLNLLLVEDDLDLAATIVDYLELEGISCDHAANGVAGLAFIRQHAYQAIILDINLPRMNGLSVCTTMRAEGIDSPVIMLTARDSLASKLEGFESGTDDYLVKPFALEELVARVKALSSRRSGQVERLQVADLVLDLREKKAHRGQRLLKLTPTGFRILELLARHSPNTVSRAALIQSVWGDEPPDSNSLKVHLFHLRRQVDQNKALPLIHTISGLGFALKANSENPV